MSRPVREDARKETKDEIKKTACQLMREHGTAGLSLRAIARAMNITAPAIYNYYPRLDDLITALLVDAFTNLAEAMRGASEAISSQPAFVRIQTVLEAYRAWALDHPVEFSMIYGNPIPGYEAPEEITTPLARRPFDILIPLFLEAKDSGLWISDPADSSLPNTIAASLRGMVTVMGLDIPESVMYVLVQVWTRIHGMVMLELFHHTQPVIGDKAAFYTYEIR
jgi:AcrR family transcriptional regulator